MKLLTLTQPWATLVAIGAKRIETRAWKTDYRGPIAIHAAKGLNGLGKRATDDDLFDLCEREPFVSALLEAGIETPRDLPRGVVVAVADLDCCFRFDDDNLRPLLRGEHHDLDRVALRREIAFGDYTFGRYGWMLEHVRPLETPVPCRGERGMPTLNPDVERLVRAQLDLQHAR